MEFGPDSKSIWFGEARGRLGNQLFGYSILQHFRHRLGVDAFINEECRRYLLKVQFHCLNRKSTIKNWLDQHLETFGTQSGCK